MSADAPDLTCPACGLRFRPGVQAGCRSCPLAGACVACCCPACGYAVIDTSRSWLATTFARWIGRRPPGRGDREGKPS